MKNKRIKRYSVFLALIIALGSCKVENLPTKTVTNSLPDKFEISGDTTKAENILWRNYFNDSNLAALIDEALKNNQELNMMLHEIEISRNEIMARKGEYQPFGFLTAGLGGEKSGHYTWNGVSEEDAKTRTDKLPKYIGEQALMGTFSWEIDVWKKLHNAKDAAVKRYLSGIEGRNFVVTNLIAEIANSYYELVVLDNQLEIVQQNIALQKDALEMVKVQKAAARVNQLAVNRFTAQVLNTENLKYEIQQQIVETENRINFLVARNPQPVKRNSANLNDIQFLKISAGIPSQLLSNRPDIRQAEQELEAAKLDIAVAKAAFYPNITLRAGIGLQAFNPIYLINPKSIAVNVLGDLIAPLINKNAIKANYYNANEKQIQAVYKYEQTVLNAHLEVINQLAGNKNYSESYATKANQVEILSSSIEISNNLFKSARADYTEVLLTQREALEAKMELMEIKKKQLNAEVNIYKALGGGWK
ncbi:TolC family protein [Emticicia agri]|uniref:Efflux transporter outer membrane subunit n=1 Tax=Emticicia agri TaxID=2492393 RepID=A0A4V1ZD77_9BACT|nr:efflux transporter outer membrane subunit [Emticicia agri]RYU95200.1 efflux transporter outer membrane subunit [Emticicia agri]